MADKKIIEKKFSKIVGKEKHIVTALIHSLSGQSPYFSLTCETYEKREYSDLFAWVSGGCQHDTIAKHFPELAKFIPFHLCDGFDGMMHYFANAFYGWEIMNGIAKWTSPSDTPEFGKQLFTSSAMLGVLPDDPHVDTIQALDAWAVCVFLHMRQPRLIEAYQAAMSELFETSTATLDKMEAFR